MFGSKKARYPLRNFHHKGPSYVELDARCEELPDLIGVEDDGFGWPGVGGGSRSSKVGGHQNHIWSGSQRILGQLVSIYFDAHHLSAALRGASWPG